MRIGLAAVAVALLGAAAAGAAAKPVAFFGCRAIGPHPIPLVRPTSMVVACGDGNFYFTKITWSSWNATGAAGSAIAHQNDCKPYCAAGHFHSYRVRLTLSQPRACKRRTVFDRVAWRFLGTKPAGIRYTDGVDFPC
jgi:hypothetical protein